MIKSDGKAVENVFMGTALALKRSGRLTEQNLLDMLKNLKLMKIFTSLNTNLSKFSKILFFR